MAHHAHPADHLDRLVTRASILCSDLREQARCHAEVERRIDEGRTIAREMDALFRGRG